MVGANHLYVGGQCILLGVVVGAELRRRGGAGEVGTIAVAAGDAYLVIELLIPECLLIVDQTA